MTAKDKAAAKSKFGRPTKYKPEYCQAIVSHMSEGASATSFAASIDVDRSTITEWTTVHPEFSIAFTRAKAKCAAWWETVARKNAVTGDGNAAITVFGLKNMGPDDWADKFEHGGGINVNINISFE